MAEHPMFPLWTDAYLADTNHLNVTEHGAYLLLLMTAWRTGTGRLLNDDAYLARCARCTPRQWLRIRDRVMAFWKLDGADWVQKRVLDELTFVAKQSRKQSSNSKARWLKTNGSEMPPHESGTANSMPPTHTLPTKEIKNKEKGPNTPDWRHRVENFKKHKRWDSNWGARPGNAYCEAPPSILQEFGLSA
jgi:uncharacterized protein YdaU (DUF1376 family)